MSRYRDLQAKLKEIDQEHLLCKYETMNTENQQYLLDQIAGLDFNYLPNLVENYVLSPRSFQLPPVIEPPEWYPKNSTNSSGQTIYDTRKYQQLGENLIRQGEIALFCVAGGQGTRLGWDAPKGTYPATPILKKSLFQVFAEQVKATEIKYSRQIPWYIMTSPLNHESTVKYFNDNDYFGLNTQQVQFLPQGVIPSFDAVTGKILMASPCEIAVNPDGHGGSLKALWTSGAIADMKKRGIKHISYIQVDNPLVRAIDPLFLGLHVHAPDSSAEMSSKMLPKTGPFEKLGNFCKVNGKTTIIEYSDLPDHLAELRAENGNLKFGAGSIAIHVLSVDFVEQLNTGNNGGFALPYHRAVKKVAYYDVELANIIEPEEANAVKLEMFVFDALPLCESSIILETERIEEFGPIKNLTGVDSAESSRALQIERAARWLENAGVKVARRREETGNTGELGKIGVMGGVVDAVIEISAFSGLDAANLVENKKSFLQNMLTVEPGAELVI